MVACPESESSAQETALALQAYVAKKQPGSFGRECHCRGLRGYEMSMIYGPVQGARENSKLCEW